MSSTFDTVVEGSSYKVTAVSGSAPTVGGINAHIKVGTTFRVVDKSDTYMSADFENLANRIPGGPTSMRSGLAKKEVDRLTVEVTDVGEEQQAAREEGGRRRRKTRARRSRLSRKTKRRQTRRRR
jgi:hypothetical protein